MGVDQKSDQNSEKRKHPRKIGETLVRFEGENFSIYSRALNVSDQGAFVATHYLLEPGTEIALHLIAPNGTESATNARVVRTNTHRSEHGDTVIGFGVEFLQL
jgi:hypothetical protein